jgi:hypothetical protein
MGEYLNWSYETYWVRKKNKGTRDLLSWLCKIKIIDFNYEKKNRYKKR